MKTSVFANPLEDAGFKIIFNKKRNMKSLIEAILDRKIDDLEYIQTEFLGASIKENKSCFDMSVRFSDGTTCIIEMQRFRLKHFNYRSLLYSSHLIQMQATAEHDRQFEYTRKNGLKILWNYSFSPVYFIGILENGWGEKNDDNTEGSLVERYRMRETTTGKDMKVDFNCIFLRLDRFTKSENESKTLLEQFAYSLKTMGNASKHPKSFTDEAITNLYDDALIANLSPEEAHQYESSKNMTTENDWLVAMSEAEESALEEGREQGRQESVKEIAKNLKSQGLSVYIIAQGTGLSVDVINSL